MSELGNCIKGKSVQSRYDEFETAARKESNACNGEYGKTKTALESVLGVHVELTREGRKCGKCADRRVKCSLKLCKKIHEALPKVQMYSEGEIKKAGLDCLHKYKEYMEKVYKVQTNIDDFCMREYNGTNHLCIARRSIATGRKQDTSSIRKLREQVEQKVQQKIKEKQGQKALQTLPPGAGESGHMESQSQASKTEGTPNQGEKAVQTKSNLIEVDPRQHLNIIFIGHVDAGKSTACGNILYILGYVDDRTIEKYEREAKEKNRESWFLAFIMDINEEERQKGKTVEVGRAHFETKDRRFTILDSPGHKNFIPNMISGAAQADIGVLIISARKGEFETGFERGGQTREHTLLARTLGINQLIVAINKMDDPTCNWSEARYDEIQKKITPFIKSCGYNINKDVFFVPISGLTGQNLSDHVSDKNSKLYDPRGSWYDTSKPTLFQILNTLSPPPWDEKGPLRIPLLEGYKDNGIIAIGKIESGTLYGNNMSCTLMPNKLKVKVLNVYLEDDEVPYAKPGENVRVKLLGVEEDQISKGFVLCDSLNPCSVVSEFIGRVAIVELLEHKPIITAGYFCIFHAHTTCEEIQFLDMLEVIDKKSKKKKIKPKFIKNDCIVTAHFLLSNPVCIEVYDKLPQLGRFTLRDQGKTIAIGKILELKG